ncbi:MAG: hypothetical protein ACOY7T_06780 [Pseudomonadota bacterium]
MEQAANLNAKATSVDFALARSDFLDAFSAVESSICRILERAGIGCKSNEPFGNRLLAFGQIEKADLLAPSRIGQRNNLVRGVGKILPIRADVVHSAMRVDRLGEEAVAIFVNAQVAHDPDAPMRVLSLDRFRKHTSKLEDYAKQLEVLNKPTSPAS